MDFKASEDIILAEAKSILLKRLRQPGGIISNIDEVRHYLIGEYAMLQAEQFGCMFLDKNYSLINHLKMFRGTISHCSVYPREIAREALLQNAVFVVLVHNHPSHIPIPSEEDVSMTKRVRDILASLDIALFDHIVVAGPNLYSMRTAGHLDT